MKVKSSHQPQAPGLWSIGETVWSLHAPPIRTPGALDGACTLLPRLPPVLLPAGFAVVLVPFSSLLAGGIDQIRTSCSSWSTRAKQSVVPRVWEDRRGEVLMFVRRSVSLLDSPRGSWSTYPPPPPFQSPPHLYPAPSHSLFISSQEQCIPSPWDCHPNVGVGWGRKL